MPEAIQVPLRSAVKDANAGIVNDTVAKQHARTESIKQRKASELETGVESFSTSFGKIVEQYADEHVADVKLQKELKGRMDQGSDLAINAISEDKKRHGWQEALFGQDIEYRAAQQQQAKNIIRDKYNETLYSISQHAGETPEEYQKRLSGTLTEIIEPFEGDKETQGLLANAWMDHAEKLSNVHFKEHYGYNLQQQRLAMDDHHEKTLETLSIEASKSTDPEQTKELYQKAQDLFNFTNKPAGASDAAARESLLGVINKGLIDGNVGGFNAATDFGFLDNLSLAEQKTHNFAQRQYQTGFDQDIGSNLARIELNALDATSPEAVDAVIDQAEQEIRQIGATRALPTERSEEIINKALLKLEKIRRAGIPKAIATSLKEEQLNVAKTGLLNEDAGIRAGTVATVHSNKILGQAHDSNILDKIREASNATDDIPDDQLYISMVKQGDAFKLKPAADYYKSRQPKPDQFIQNTKSLIHALSTGSFEGKDGRYNEDGLNAISMINQFDGVKLQNDLGESYNTLELIRLGIQSGDTTQNIMKSIEDYKNFDGQVKGIWGGAETRQDHIKYRISLAKTPQGGTLIPNPTPAMLTQATSNYKKWMKIYDNDETAANARLSNWLAGNTSTVRGQVITGKNWGIKFGYPLDTLLNAMDRTQRYTATGSPVSYMSTQLAPLVGKQGEPVPSTEYMKHLRFETSPDGESILMSTANGLQVEHITKDELQIEANYLNQQKKMDDVLTVEQKVQAHGQHQGQGIITDWKTLFGKSEDKNVQTHSQRPGIITNWKTQFGGAEDKEDK